MNIENIKCPSCNNQLQLTDYHQPLKLILCHKCPKGTLFKKRYIYLSSWIMYDDNNNITGYNLVNIRPDFNIIYSLCADIHGNCTCYSVIKTDTCLVDQFTVNNVIQISNKNLLDLRSFISKAFKMVNII